MSTRSTSRTDEPESLDDQLDRMGKAITRAFSSLENSMIVACVAFEKLAEAFGAMVSRHLWWPFTSDEWLAFAWRSLMARRYHAAWVCLRRGFRAHCEEINL